MNFSKSMLPQLFLLLSYPSKPTRPLIYQYITSPEYLAKAANNGDDMVGFSTMQAMRLDSVRKFEIEPTVIATTLQVLQLFGSHGCEGLVLWIGDVNEGHARISRALVPDQRPLKSEEGVGYSVDAETLFQLNRKLSETGLRLIAQVHSHPSEAYHSEADDRYAIVTADGGLSLVVPNFGKAPADPTLWAVYRLSNGSWRELDQSEARSLLNVVAPA